MAGTGSPKPYLFNADNVARNAPASWHSPGTAIDTSYEALDRMARQAQREHNAPPCRPSLLEPLPGAEPPAELAAHRWHGDAGTIGIALAGALSVRSIAEPHLAPWLARWAECESAPALFPPVDRHCDAFSQWWARTSRSLQTAADLRAVNEVPAW